MHLGHHFHHKAVVHRLVGIDDHRHLAVPERLEHVVETRKVDHHVGNVEFLVLSDRNLQELLLFHGRSFCLGQVHLDTLAHERRRNNEHNQNREHDIDHVREVHFLLKFFTATALHYAS